MQLLGEDAHDAKMPELDAHSQNESQPGDHCIGEMDRRAPDFGMDDAIERPIHDFVAAWAAGSGAKMAECFTEDAYFVAFDGTRLNGRQGDR